MDVGWVLAIAALGLLLLGYGLHRVLVWAEQRGYVYYREKSRSPGPPLGLLDQIYKPEVEYVVEEEASAHVRAEKDDTGRGDDPVP